MAFHERLKQARECAEMTQAQVASLLGIAKSTYSGYETGKSEPSMNIIANLMRLFNISPEFLWQDEMESQITSVHTENHRRNSDVYAQNADEEELLATYRTLVPSAKEAVLTTLRAFAGNPDFRKDIQSDAAV